MHICLIFRSKKRQVMGGNAMTRLGIRSTWDAENNVLEFNIFFLCMYKYYVPKIHCRSYLHSILVLLTKVVVIRLSNHRPQRMAEVSKEANIHGKFDYIRLMCSTQPGLKK